MTDYLSRDREHLASMQRKRRERMVRIDYMPDRTAVAILQARRMQLRPGSPSATNSALLDAIVTEWAQLTGIKYGEEPKAPTSGRRPEFSDTSARANDSGFCHPPKGQAKATGSMIRVTCGARRRRDGLPCQALSVAGKQRCKWHGGASTGPTTCKGRAISLANLRQHRQGEIHSHCEDRSTTKSKTAIAAAISGQKMAAKVATKSEGSHPSPTPSKYP